MAGCFALSIISGAMYLNYYMGDSLITWVKGQKDAGIAIGVLQLINALLYGVDALAFIYYEQIRQPEHVNYFRHH